jgi:hypothetical protein
VPMTPREQVPDLTFPRRRPPAPESGRVSPVHTAGRRPRADPTRLVTVVLLVDPVRLDRSGDRRPPAGAQPGETGSRAPKMLPSVSLK